MAQPLSQTLFGTDGIRGVAGEFPLDEETVQQIGAALAANLARQLGRPPDIVIGRDTRESGPSIEEALVRGARAAGSRVESAGVITTPGVAYIARSTPFDAGVVISASHNPYYDNGIKVFSSSGRKLADEMERRIEHALAGWDSGNLGLGKHPSKSGAAPGDVDSSRLYRDRYIDYLVDEAGLGLRLDGLRLGLDCANGAASAIAPEVFARLGASVEVVSATPDGRNINQGCGSLHPDRLGGVVRDHGLDVGVAFDGDADRSLFVDERGHLVDGDCTMLILGEYMKSRGRLAGGLVVGTVMSNLGLEIALRERGISLLRTQVGDRYVLEQLLARKASLGGEQSGHIIFPDISLAGDGIITAIQLLWAARDLGRTLGDLASQLPRYPQVLVNIRVGRKPPLETLPEVSAEIARMERSMRGRGRLLVRYSGTENLARVMIEGEDQTKIEEQANRLAEVIKRALG